MAILNKNSEYVRLDYAGSQEVRTDLTFTKALKIPEAVNANEAVNLQQLTNSITQTKNELLNSGAEKINKATLQLAQFGNGFIGSSNYGGIGNVTFVTDDRLPLFVVAWSWTSQGENVYPIYDKWTFWLAKDPTPTNFINKRIIADPNNLTPDDETYLNDFGSVMKCEAWLASLYSSNLKDWSSPVYLFKEIWSKSVSNSSNVNIGCINNNPNSQFIEISLDVTSDLFKEIAALQVSVYSNSSNFSYNYGCPNLFIDWKLNDKQCVSHYLTFTKEECITSKKPYFFTPLYRDESINSQFFDTAKAVSIAGDAVFRKAEYIASSDSFALVDL